MFFYSNLKHFVILITMELKNVPNEQNRLGFYTYQNQPMINKIPISWNTSGPVNYDGVRPPNPSLTVGGFNPQGSGNPLYQIEARVPYKVQYLVNKYGGLQTKFGTNLGA
jgi:hypothetical protein